MLAEQPAELVLSCAEWEITHKHALSHLLTSDMVALGVVTGAQGTGEQNSLTGLTDPNGLKQGIKPALTDCRSPGSVATD